MVERAKKHPKITFKTPYTVTKTFADETGLTHINLMNLETKKEEKVEVPGLFYAIGHTPNSKIFTPAVKVDNQGFIDVKNFTETSVPGVFAAGDVADHVFKC